MYFFKCCLQQGVHVNFILIKGEESVLHNYIPDSRERVKTAWRGWWRGQQNWLPHWWEARFPSLLGSLYLWNLLWAGWQPERLNWCHLMASFWATNLWFWADNQGGGCSSAWGYCPCSGNGQMGCEPASKLFQPWPDAISDDFHHYAQCQGIILQCLVHLSPWNRGACCDQSVVPTSQLWVTSVLIAVLLGQGGFLNLWEWKQMALKVTNKLFIDGCVFLGFVFKMLSIKIRFEF